MRRKAKSQQIGGASKFYIRPEVSQSNERTLVLLHGDTFGVFDRFGDVYSEQSGLFYRDTRHLSRSQLLINGVPPLLLSATARQDNILLTIDLTNPDITLPGGDVLRRGSLHIFRSKYLIDGACFDRVVVHSYHAKRLDVSLVFRLQVDFADIFEVRGRQRTKRGMMLPVEVGKSSVKFAYRGLDDKERSTQVHPWPTENGISASQIAMQFPLDPDEHKECGLRISCDGSRHESVGYETGLRKVAEERRDSALAAVNIETSCETLNEWLARSRADLGMLLAETKFGPYPYAGVPWFSTVFGRDGIITALELLWLAPSVAKGVLSYLAATQATTYEAERDAQPGKVLHETRKGEMAGLGEVPFGQYYGSVDATPLFVFLSAAYYERTGDLAFMRAIWPNIEAALSWMDRDGDADKDGFIEYSRHSALGLAQQGWKDSNDSVFDAEGRIPEGPIALCEVQAYAYAAKSRIAVVASDLGFEEVSRGLFRQAEDLRKRFEQVFWCQEISMFALALDGAKRQCQVRSSNAGQCLFSGITSREKSRLVIDSLLSTDMFSGWGIRTIAATESRFNPMAYHNGSVWPHDNALVAFGLIKCRDKTLALRILTGLLDLSVFAELHRLPELICGFARRAGSGPTLYPVACSPQAWAAGAVFLILQACLGVSISGTKSRIYLHHGALPEKVEEVHIRNLAVGESSLDLSFYQHAGKVRFEVPRRNGNIEIIDLP